MCNISNYYRALILIFVGWPCINFLGRYWTPSQSSPMQSFINKLSSIIILFISSHQKVTCRQTLSISQKISLLFLIIILNNKLNMVFIYFHLILILISYPLDKFVPTFNIDGPIKIPEFLKCHYILRYSCNIVLYTIILSNLNNTQCIIVYVISLLIYLIVIYIYIFCIYIGILNICILSILNTSMRYSIVHGTYNYNNNVCTPQIKF